MLYWHRSMDREQANAWLRGHVAKLLDFDGQVAHGDRGVTL
jgi:hypothetical protein